MQYCEHIKDFLTTDYTTVAPVSSTKYEQLSL